MRSSVANCSVTFLAVALIGIVLMAAQLALPARVDSRQVPYGFEDGGDPDAPDQVTRITDTMESIVPVTGAGAPDAASPSSSRISQGSASRVEPRVICLRRERRDLVFRLGFSIASLVLAF
jgi:hypothetical protein